MPDIYTDIEAEIRAGIPNERERLKDAMKNLEFYRADFSRVAPQRIPGQQWDLKRYPRNVPVMRKVVQSLTANLYARGPTRTLKAPDDAPSTNHDAASLWLNRVYRANHIDAFWQDADRLSTAADIAAFQVWPDKDPARPIRVSLWQADQLVVWIDRDNPLKAIAVATLDMYDEQRRLTLWTPNEKVTFLTTKYDRSQTAGGTAYTFASREATYCPGMLPFSFVTHEYPTTDFLCPGPGTNLRDLNDGVNFALTETFDSIRFNLRPVVVMKNVRAGYRPNSPVTPGDIWHLPQAGDGSENNPPQDASYLQADSSFVAAGWDDLEHYLDLTLEMHGVPPAAIRMIQDSARSGVSIIAEQAPLILWAESRQRPYQCYEDDLAALVLRIGHQHLRVQQEREYLTTASQLEDVSYEPGLMLRWPDMYPRIPGQETDQSDQWRLDNRLTSRTMLLMQRESLTREEAEAKLEEIAEDLKNEAELFGDLAPESLQEQEQGETKAEQDKEYALTGEQNGDGSDDEE